MPHVSPKPLTHEKRRAVKTQAAVKVQSLEEFIGSPQPHTPQQDLEIFGTCIGKPTWVPPKESSAELAKSMLNSFGHAATKSEAWQGTVKAHRSQFTEVREIELPRASIRLPQGRLFVTVTQQANFAQIEEVIPPCVQTRLDEFLAGPGKQRGVKVYYLKPLCVEVGNELIFTTREELDGAIEQIQTEVFDEYRRRYLGHRVRRLAIGTLDASLAIPRAILKYYVNRKKREIDAYHAKLEFERRKRALKAVRTRKKYRKDECTFDEILALTNPPERKDVIDHYVKDNVFSDVDRELFLLASTAALPWFATLSLAAFKLLAVSLATGASVTVCDPAFVAEMPGRKGKLLKIGHFDEVDGVTHVEI